METRNEKNFRRNSLLFFVKIQHKILLNANTETVLEALLKIYKT